MKKILTLLPVLLLLTGCGTDTAMEEALALRSQCLGANEIRFTAEVTADYIDTVEEFSLSCAVDTAGVLAFEVVSPEEISGITGTVSGDAAALTFDGTVLAFPMMAGDRLSPVSAPWVMMQALRSGYIVSVGQEDGVLHITVDESYEDDAMTVDVWVQNGAILAAEISWDGVRQVCLEISDLVID